MKKCKLCKKVYPNEYHFCPVCGGILVEKIGDKDV